MSSISVFRVSTHANSAVSLLFPPSSQHVLQSLYTSPVTARTIITVYFACHSMYYNHCTLRLSQHVLQSLYTARVTACTRITVQCVSQHVLQSLDTVRVTACTTVTVHCASQHVLQSLYTARVTACTTVTSDITEAEDQNRMDGTARWLLHTETIQE